MLDALMFWVAELKSLALFKNLPIFVPATSLVNISVKYRFLRPKVFYIDSALRKTINIAYNQEL